jgi:DNA mismatch repair protein MutS
MENPLIIDEQTISDLAIFGQAGKPSIYDLYNRTATQGGAAILEELFRHPLADDRSINARSALYRFFGERDYTFPIEAATVGTVVYYLENTDVRSQLQTGGQSIGQRLKDMVATDSDYIFVHDGVQAALRLCYQVGQFISQLESRVAGTGYEAAFGELVYMFDAPPFTELRQQASAKFEVKLTHVALAEFDRSIRFDHRDEVLQLLHLLYELDVCIAIGQVARKRNLHFASALPKEAGAIHYKKVYHPQVEGAIANDLDLDSHHNVLFLTGANMAGKSTLMKSVGVALYLAHMGFPVAVEEFTFAVRDGIYTSINLADNLNMGASHYYAEVLRVKEVARELSEGKQLFVIFDELFRGTNVKDAFDATIALTRAFCRKRASQFIISTHIMEAGELLQQELLPIKYQYLPTQMQGNTPVYTRVLKEGITADRQGMIIIENEGILAMLDAGLKQKEEEPCHS